MSDGNSSTTGSSFDDDSLPHRTGKVSGLLRKFRQLNNPPPSSPSSAASGSTVRHYSLQSRCLPHHLPTSSALNDARKHELDVIEDEVTSGVEGRYFKRVDSLVEHGQNKFESFEECSEDSDDDDVVSVLRQQKRGSGSSGSDNFAFLTDTLLANEEEEIHSPDGVTLKSWHKALRHHRRLGLATVLYQGVRSDLDPVKFLQRILQVHSAIYNKIT